MPYQAFATRPFRSTRWIMCPIVIGLVCCSLQTMHGDDWPYWLGPKHDSVWRETGIIEEFGESGPDVAWRIEVNPGYTGPSVSDGRVYLMDRIVDDAEGGDEAPEGLPRGVIPGKERILCVDAENGDLVWERIYDCPYEKLSYPEGPRTSPVIEGDFVWTLGAMGHLKCLNKETGAIVWEALLTERFECTAPIWGFAATPRIDGDKLICVVGGEGSALVAIDKNTGDTIWQTLTAEEVGYAPPVFHGEEENRQLIYWYDVAISGVDPETGEELWSVKTPDVESPSRPVVTIVTPRVVEDMVYVSDFYNGSTMIRLQPDRAGAEVVWRDKPLAFPFRDQLNILMTTPMIKDGHIYAISGSGQSRCLKVDTGELVWRDDRPFDGERKPDFATVFYVENDGRYFVFSDQGELLIAKMTPEGLEVIDQAKILEPVGFARGRNVVWSHPAFANQCMFARNDDELVCVNLAKEKSSEPE